MIVYSKVAQWHNSMGGMIFEICRKRHDPLSAISMVIMLFEYSIAACSSIMNTFTGPDPIERCLPKSWRFSCHLNGDEAGWVS